jgi:hypothetical protein
MEKTRMKRKKLVVGIAVLGVGLMGTVSGRAGDPLPNTLTAEEKAAGWQLLFDGQSLAGWRAYAKSGQPIGEGWKIENGTLKKAAGEKGGDIITENTFNDFELSWEWRIEKEGNNGVKYLVTEARPSAPGHEYQMIDDLAEKWRTLDPRSRTAAFYDVLPTTTSKPLRPAGEWNASRIIVRGNQVEHWLNGEKVLDYELGSETVRKAVADSKFKVYPEFGNKIRGHIMLTDHRDAAWFRNIKLRELP